MKIGRNTLVRLSTLFIIFIVLVGIVYVGIPYAFGCDKPFMVVVSRSMEPTIHVNDLIVIRGVEPTDIKVGDIIVFKSPVSPDMLIVHRVVKIVEKDGETLFKTKGDNNPLPDPWFIGEDNLVGKVVIIIPYIGLLARILIENPLLKISLVSLIIILIIYLEYRDVMEKRVIEET